MRTIAVVLAASISWVYFARTETRVLVGITSMAFVFACDMDLQSTTTRFQFALSQLFKLLEPKTINSARKSISKLARVTQYLLG